MLGAFSDLCALETQKQDQNHVLSKCKPSQILVSKAPLGLVVLSRPTELHLWLSDHG